MSSLKHILYVEDEPVPRENVTAFLERAGFSVTAPDSKLAALRYLDDGLPDLAIIDIDLSKIDQGDRTGGFDVCKALRRRSDKIPILILTQYSDTYKRHSAFMLEVDDYLEKEYFYSNGSLDALDLLLARIKALSARIASYANVPESRQVVGDLEIDQERNRIFWKGKPVSLRLTETWIVRDLAGHAGQARSIDALMRAAHLCVSENAIAQRIVAIRRQFRALDPTFGCIQTERPQQYRWTC
jgi:two-component system OmpR family response regulator